jgi:hypothetical protein
VTDEARGEALPCACARCTSQDRLATAVERAHPGIEQQLLVNTAMLLFVEARKASPAPAYAVAPLVDHAVSDAEALVARLLRARVPLP